MNFLAFLVVAIVLFSFELFLIAIESVGGFLGNFFDLFRYIIPNTSVGNGMTKYLYLVIIVVCLIVVMGSAFSMRSNIFRKLYFISPFFHFFTFSLYIRFGLDERPSTILTRTEKVGDLFTLVISFVITLIYIGILFKVHGFFEKKKRQIYKIKSTKKRQSQEYKFTQHFLQMNQAEQEYHFDKTSAKDIKKMLSHMCTKDREYWSSRFERINGR